MKHLETETQPADTPHRPTTIPELVEFYYTFVKPLYSSVQLANHLPVEVLFEMNAAFDHLTRHWHYQEAEAEVVAKAHSHLKRGCLDIFKLAVKGARQQFEELRTIDTSIVDNGDFDRGLLELWHRIKIGAENARVNEGDTKKDDGKAVLAFSMWLPVYEDCVKLDKDYYQHLHLDWARKREGVNKWKERGYGVLASLAAAGIIWIATQCHSWMHSKATPQGNPTVKSIGPDGDMKDSP